MITVNVLEAIGELDLASVAIIIEVSLWVLIK